MLGYIFFPGSYIHIEELKKGYAVVSNTTTKKRNEWRGIEGVGAYPMAIISPAQPWRRECEGLCLWWNSNHFCTITYDMMSMRGRAIRRTSTRATPCCFRHYSNRTIMFRHCSSFRWHDEWARPVDNEECFVLLQSLLARRMNIDVHRISTPNNRRDV